MLLGQQSGPSPAMRQAIDEFRSQTTIRATKGGPAQPGVQAPQRQAPRAWHGRLYENFRNNYLDAIPHQIVQRGGEQRKLRRNQFGVNLTGPVYIPGIYNGAGKTFFTFSFEGMRESVGQTNLYTIPTSLERTGEWGHVVDPAGNPLKIYDPTTTAPNPLYDPTQQVGIDNLQYNRQQFPENRIPVTRLDPVAQSALQYYPQPNANAGPFFRNNYFVVSNEINRADGFILTMDHTFTPKQRATIRINRSIGLYTPAPIFNTLANPNNPPMNIEDRGARFEHVYTASAGNINTLQLEANSQRNVSDTPLDANGKPFPRYQVDGYLNTGAQNPLMREARNNFQISDTFASRAGKHRLSIQEEVTQNQINVFRPQWPSGHFRFTPGLTSLPGIINTGHGFASFLLGGASFAEETVLTSPNYYRWNSFRSVFSDQWQVAPSLTLTFGANFEVYTQRIEKYDRQSNISFREINPANGVPGALVAANRGGYGRTFAPTWMKVEPSAALAWSMFGDNNTVLRLNFDRRYGNPQHSNFHFGTQAFNGVPVYLSPNQQLEPAVVLADGLQRTQTFPDLRPEAANGTVAHLFDVSDRQPTSTTYRASIQRQLAAFLILTVTAEYNMRRNQFIGRQAVNPNAIPLDALSYRDKLNDLAFSQTLRPYPQFQDFDVANFFPAGRLRSDYLFAELEKRTSGGLALKASYGYYRQWDNYSQNIQDFYNLQNEWTYSAFFNPHGFDFNYIYELPFGAGKTFLNRPGFGSWLFGNWSVSGVGSIWSGSPIQLQAQFNNTGGVVPNLRPNTVPGVDPKPAKQTPDMWFNPAAFVQPADFSTGNVPRVHPTLRNPGGWNTDATLSKRFPIGGERTLEFFGSLFNAFNHANWSWPNTQIGTRAAPNALAGRIIGSNGGRVVQLSLRLNF